jgi:DNA-3-methyladenine glycosylase
MRARRGAMAERLLAAGPARLTEALGITGDLNGHDLRKPPLWLAAGVPVPAWRRRRGVRIGISVGRERKLRFTELDNPCVSK